jgi:putative DNA primase/helicase
MQRRLQVMPFSHRFVESKDRDETLFTRIWENEMSGVLNRAIEGYLRLVERKMRFKLPPDVRKANQSFIVQANPLARFVADGCAREAGAKCLLRIFYGKYCEWAEKSGITMRQQQAVVHRNLEHMGFKVDHSNQGTMVFGLKPK